MNAVIGLDLDINFLTAIDFIMRIITPEDLVQYLYNETSPHKESEIKTALENDLELREAFEQMVLAKKQLQEQQHSPREEVMKKILDHADKTFTHLHSH